MPELSLLACYAHPDDEQGITGVMRRSLDHGVRVGLVCATRGEVGEIAHPSLATPETLGEVREGELQEAMRIVGVKDVYFLDYRDSGMAGTAENADPRNFINANEAEAVGKLVKIIRAFKPTVMITFDETGGYGHPDHIAIHKWTTQAFHAAAQSEQYPDIGAPFQAGRLYYASVPRSMRQLMVEWMKENNVESVFSRIPADKFGMPDELVTHRIPVREYITLKRQSLSAHRTQMNPDSPFAKMPEEMTNFWRGLEHYAFAAGTPLPSDYDPLDLFTGLR